MTDIKTGFPKNLAYNLKRLAGGFTKQKVKVLPDKSSADANGVVRFLLPRGSLVDFRSLALFFKGSCSGTGTYLNFPRYSSSLIQSLTLTANNITLCSINEYGFLYNALMDMEGADSSQNTKRSPEYFDPTIKWSQEASSGTALTNENKIIAVRKTDYTDIGAHETDVNMVINHFLGFISSISTPVLDLQDIGDVYLTIQFAPASVLYSVVDTTAPAPSGANFTLTDIYITIDKIAFQSAEYYQLKQEQLLSDGLKVAYYDYWTAVGSSTTKSSGVNMNFSVNSGSLDQLIATFRRSDYQTIKPLIMYGGNTINSGTHITLDEYNANPVAYTNHHPTALETFGTSNLGDGFANSYAFQRPGNDLIGSQWSINSTSIDQYSLTPTEIFQKNLQYTGFQNLDLGSSGCHPGMKSVLHFLKYYFIDICSLENISGDNQMWISGMNGLNGGIVVNYQATFKSTNTQVVYPYIYCRSTKQLTIKAGRQLEVV